MVLIEPFILIACATAVTCAAVILPLTLIVPPVAIRLRAVFALSEKMLVPAKKIIDGVLVLLHPPTPPQDPFAASKVTLLLDKALEITPAPMQSTLIDSGSVNQLPVLPWGADVSMDKLAP